MIRTLLIIAGAALVLSLVTLGGAAALGGNDMARHGWSWTITDTDGDNIHFERIKGGGTDAMGPTVSRTLDWTGGDSLVIDDSLNVDYVQGAVAGVAITGPKALVDRVQLEGSRLSIGDGDERVVFGWDSGHFRAQSERDELRIVVTAPAVSRFELNGSQRLNISGYDQPALSIAVSGSGEVEATGRTEALTLTIDGSGEADLASLATTDATVSISGSGDAVVAPTGRADLNISGSGDIEVASRPATVNQNISGSGDVDLRG
ncbi:MAG: DUF2807 domain-containing protein [Alphaproteobacteria bacterium]|nr:DUF2807 domain-containing protein [Alphaproteobacteria bacterium]MBU2378143.1 DUF2807 domain-containing protein [Alphaproteobacteria bacterium]